MSDHIRYDLLTQKALRGVVRDVLTETAKKGLPGEHHFYISFDTQAEGVRLSERMRAQYPEQMTIILQHQYWDLIVSERGFEVGLSFGGVPEKLFVPFDSIKGFFDPAVQFGLQFEEVADDEGSEEIATPAEKAGRKKRALPVSGQSAPEPVPAAAEEKQKKETRQKTPETSDKPTGGEVVRLDRFRKK
jgi:uncharacterized protein